jgi:hypothetical protein
MTDCVPSLPGENCALGSALVPVEPYHIGWGFDYGCDLYLVHSCYHGHGHTCLTQQKGMPNHYFSKYSKVHIIKPSFFSSQEYIQLEKKKTYFWNYKAN